MKLTIPSIFSLRKSILFALILASPLSHAGSWEYRNYSSGLVVSTTASTPAAQPPAPAPAPAVMTLNSSDKAPNLALSNGDLTVKTTGACSNCPSAYSSVRATVSKSAGKWYWEVTSDATIGSWNVYPCGISPSGAPLNRLAGYDMPGAYGFTPGGTQAGTVYSCLLDLTANTFSIKKNGVSIGSMSINAGSYFPTVGLYSSDTYTFNFGQTTFKFAPPAGFNTSTW